MISEQDFDFTTTKVMIVKYAHNKYQPQEIVERAISIKDGKNPEYPNFDYHLFENNCEHFATWCVTGEQFSVQIGKIRMAMKLFFSKGWKGISNEGERNNKAFKRGLLCKPCYDRNKKLFDVKKRQIRSKEDVKIGDIITFTYWLLDHDAVVMNIESGPRNKIVLQIAHYAFCGPFAHRTIKKETMTFTLDGSVKVSNYCEPEYRIFSADEVVKRANERVGEQLFVAFSNDSSHFARWCKLKLTR